MKLQSLLTEGRKVPAVVDRLITTIEIKGLYTEGIYRKAGACTKVKQLRKELETGEFFTLNLLIFLRKT